MEKENYLGRKGKNCVRYKSANYNIKNENLNKKDFLKKFFYQLVFAITIFIGFYLIKDINYPCIEKFKEGLKCSLNYNVDLKKIPKKLIHIVNSFINTNKEINKQESSENGVVESMEKSDYLKSLEI